jgi:hypothetical protein
MKDLKEYAVRLQAQEPDPFKDPKQPENPEPSPNPAEPYPVTDPVPEPNPEPLPFPGPPEPIPQYPPDVVF